MNYRGLEQRLFNASTSLYQGIGSALGRVYRHKERIALALGVGSGAVGGGLGVYDAVANPPAVVMAVKDAVKGSALEHWNNVSVRLRNLGAKTAYADPSLTQFPVGDVPLFLGDGLMRIWGFNNETKKFSMYDPKVPSLSDLGMINDRDGYWVLTNGNVRFPVQLYKGWNLTAGASLIDGIENSKPTVSKEAWEYFQDIAVAREGGPLENECRYFRIGGWEDPIRFRVEGKPLQSHLELLDKTHAELRELGYDIQPAGDSEANLTYILNVDRGTILGYPNLFPWVRREIDSMAGFVHWDKFSGLDYTIRRVRVFVRDIPLQINAAIVEEATQAITGLCNDSVKHPWSVFYESPDRSRFQPEEYATTYLPIDREVIRLKANPLIRRGMTLDQVRRVIRVVE